MHENKNINVPVRINPVVLNDSSKPSQFQLPDSFLNPFSWINAPSCVSVTQQKPNSQDLTVISSTPCVSCSDATGRWGGQFEISTVLLSSQTLPYLKKTPPPPLLLMFLLFIALCNPLLLSPPPAHKLISAHSRAPLCGCTEFCPMCYFNAFSI